MNDLSCRLFGRFVARSGDQPLSQLRHARAQELLCWLLLSGDRPHHREVVASQLWGDVPTKQARKLMRQALWQLQSALRTTGEDGDPDMLVIDADWIQLSPGRAPGLWVDIFEFHDAFDRLQPVEGADLDPEDYRLAQRAVELYRGDLLEGWYQDWCQEERQRFQAMYIVLADKLATCCEARHRYDLAAMYAGRILRLDRAHERTHRRLMRMQYQAGDRTAALRQYQRCREALADELGVEPSHTTERLYTRLAGASEHEPLPGEASSRDSWVALMPEMLERLEQLQTLLDGLRAEVRDHPAMQDRRLPAGG